MRTYSFFPAPCATVLLAGLSACGGADGGGGTKIELTELEGIYAVDSYTRNDASCTSDGDSVLDEVSDRFMVLIVGDVLGQSVLHAYSCADEAACQQKAEEVRGMKGGGYEYGFTLDDATSDGAKGKIAWAGSGEGNQCEGRVEDVTLTREGDTIVVRVETTPSKPFDQEDGVCWTDDAEAAAEGGTCQSVDVIKAMRTADLSP